MQQMRAKHFVPIVSRFTSWESTSLKCNLDTRKLFPRERITIVVKDTNERFVRQIRVFEFIIRIDQKKNLSPTSTHMFRYSVFSLFTPRLAWFGSEFYARNLFRLASIFHQHCVNSIRSLCFYVADLW